MRSMLNYIPDGYTQPGYIEAVAGLHGSLRFSYRPYTSEERAKTMLPINQASPDRRPTLYMQAIIKKLTAWDLVDQKEQALPISIATLRVLVPTLFDVLVDVVLGFRPSDVDPLWTADEQDENAAAVADSMANGVTVGQITEATDEKN